VATYYIIGGERSRSAVAPLPSTVATAEVWSGTMLPNATVAWFEVDPGDAVTSFPARYGHEVVFWPVSSTWILFGGMNGTHTFKDAWSTLDFMNWNEVLPESSANAPAARSHFGMAVVDAAEGGTNIVLFGGTNPHLRNNNTGALCLV